MLVRPGTFRNHTSPALKAWVDTLRTFHANGYDGFILDAEDISTINQVSTGTTPVTAVTQPMGWFGDKHLGMQLGPELVTNGGPFVNTGGWVAAAAVNNVGGASISIVSGKLRVTNDATGTDFGLGSWAFTTVVGKAYKITITRGDTSTGSPAYFYVGTAPNSNGAIVNLANIVANTATFVATSTTSYLNLGAYQNVANSWAEWGIASVRLLDGNHAIQATAAARPSWQVDANGHHYAQFLGTDDSLSCATGGGGSTGFLFCAALKPTGGAGTLRTIYSDVGTNTGYKVQIDVNNKLSFSAGDNAAFTTKVSTADFAVGTTYLLTCWDDGTNLNVQINSAAAETVARPVVVAGTAGYTLGKDNGAASSFIIADFYRADGIKNWSGTAAQLAAIQSWVKAGAGL